MRTLQCNIKVGLLAPTYTSVPRGRVTRTGELCKPGGVPCGQEFAICGADEETGRVRDTAHPAWHKMRRPDASRRWLAREFLYVCRFVQMHPSHSGEFASDCEYPMVS